MQSIKIPTPCTENWSNMTPTQKGAFCEKCAVDVVDFSKLSNEEVTAYLSSKKDQKICGKFDNRQLDELNTDSNWNKTSSWKTSMSKFVAALIIGFGISLFNGLQAQTGNDIRLQTLGMIALPIKIDTLKTDSVKVIKAPEENHRMGKIKIDPPIIPKETLVIPESFDIMGEIEIVPNETEVLDSIIPDNSSEKQNARNKIIPDLFKAFLFPNPTVDHSNLTIINQTKQNFSIQLLDLNGKEIKKIFTGNINNEKRNIIIDLNQEQAGIYYIKISTPKEEKTLKIQKLQ